MRATRTFIAAGAALLIAAPLFAQEGGAGSTSGSAPKPPAASTQPTMVIQHMNPADARGLNMFESPKITDVPYTGFKLDWGAAFTQQFQGLKHENAAAPRMVAGVDANKLVNIGKGFNNATANLNLNAQLAPGIRVALTTYLSSRRHNEAWVKDGYFLIDASPIDYAPLHKVMKYVTIKAGHFEINYGDGHFRRSDNGNAILNPFVGNLILDAFTTEVGGEVYVRANGFMAMAAVTGGEIKGNILAPEKRSPALITKLGFDRQLSPDLRVRLTGSNYRIEKSPSNTLFNGDRAGSRYWYVLENTTATATAQASSGLVNPGFGYKVNAYQVNPFVEFKGMEVFGVIEKAKGRSATETTEREWNQYAVDGVYRLLDDKIFAAARYNTASGKLIGMANEVTVNRYQLGAGWYITPSVLLKGEYANQKYVDFPTTDIRSGGRFKGFVIEGVVAF